MRVKLHAHSLALLAANFREVLSYLPSSRLSFLRKATPSRTMLSSETATTTSAETSVVSDDVLDKVLVIAIEASKKAGDIILGNAGGVEVTERKANSRDLLTLIDPLCEQVIRDTVIEAFPNHDFLGEEDVPPGKDASSAALDSKLATNSSGWLWIVDPIDGTTNFVSMRRMYLLKLSSNLTS